MTILTTSILWATLALSGDAIADDARPLDGMRFAQIRIQEHIIIRVPRSIPAGPIPAARIAGPPPTPLHWNERKAEKCVKLHDLAGALVIERDSIDLLMNGGKRMRAQLGRECPSISFYQGFYVRPTSDGMLCADRDVIRSRSGGECRITKLKSLVPAR